MKFKHNKRRNTAFLYEALVKELTRATIQNNKKKKQIIIRTLKEFFNKNSVLGKELEIYKTLNETFLLKEKDAEKLLSEIKKMYKSTIDTGNVYSAQSKLISQINKNISPNTFSNFVPNYKNLASIFQIFNAEAPVKSRVLMEGQIIKRMTSKKQEQEEQKMQISNTTLKIFTKKFNNSYEELFSEQKIFLNEEITRLKEEVAGSLELQEIKNDSEMVSKTKNVLKVLENFKGQHITEELLLKVLKIQRLTGEIGTDAK